MTGFSRFCSSALSSFHILSMVTRCPMEPDMIGQNVSQNECLFTSYNLRVYICEIPLAMSSFNLLLASIDSFPFKGATFLLSDSPSSKNCKKCNFQFHNTITIVHTFLKGYFFFFASSAHAVAMQKPPLTFGRNVFSLLLEIL